MKILVAFTLLLLVSVSTGNAIAKVYNSIDEFKLIHPEVKLIKLIAEDHEVDGSRSYSLGHRQTGNAYMSTFHEQRMKLIFIKFLGDAVVANANNKKSWPVSQNVTTTLSYPSSGGSGAFLTFVLVNCDQSSNIGQAYVTYGGVGQHFIQIIIEARVTTYFNYAAFFYGIK